MFSSMKYCWRKKIRVLIYWNLGGFCGLGLVIRDAVRNSAMRCLQSSVRMFMNFSANCLDSASGVLDVD